MASAGAPRPVALDHNFPEPIVRAVARFLPEVSFHWVRDLGTHFPDLDDHDLVYEVHRSGFSLMVTADYKLQRDPRVLVAVEQTRMTLLIVEKAAHDPILATGVLLRDLAPVLRKDHPKGLLYRVRPSAPRADRARRLADNLQEGLRYDDHAAVHARPREHVDRYLPGDARRLV